MRILYHNPIPTSVYAGRTIFNGYKNAFTDLGHNFRALEANSNLGTVIDKFKPDIFITSLSPMYLKGLNFNVVKNARSKGLKVFVQIPFWKSVFDKSRINEDKGLSQRPELIKLLNFGDFADYLYNSCEQNDPRMEGLTQALGRNYYTIPLAADAIALKPVLDKKFSADISFVGTLLPGKVEFFNKYVFPLCKKYDLKIYGQDWKTLDKGLGWVQKFGQYFAILPLSNIRKPGLSLQDEASIYLNSKICINVHEDYQKKYGGDCNERTFKIPFSSGFEITDRVACISKYFKEGREIVIADENDWFDKIDHYMNNPLERQRITEAGKANVFYSHTYHNRAKMFLEVSNTNVI